MIWSLIWKETREHTWRVLACIAVAVALQLASFAADQKMVLWMRDALLYYAPLFGLFLALGPVARERQLRTYETLLARPVRPAALWTVKLLTGCAGLVALMLIILGTGAILLSCTAAPQSTIMVWGSHIFWPAVLNALVLYTWMFSASSGGRNELAAGGRVLALLALAYGGQMLIDRLGGPLRPWLHFASPWAAAELPIQAGWHTWWWRYMPGWWSVPGWWMWLLQALTVLAVLTLGYRQFVRP